MHWIQFISSWAWGTGTNSFSQRSPSLAEWQGEGMGAAAPHLEPPMCLRTSVPYQTLQLLEDGSKLIILAQIFRFYFSPLIFVSVTYKMHLRSWCIGALQIFTMMMMTTTTVDWSNCVLVRIYKTNYEIYYANFIIFLSCLMTQKILYSKQVL